MDFCFFLHFYIWIIVYVGLSGLKRAWNGLRTNSQESRNSLAHSESSPFADPESMLTFSEVDTELGEFLCNTFIYKYTQQTIKILVLNILKVKIHLIN